MAVSHVLTVFLQFSLVFSNIFYIISAKKCADVGCKVPISIATALQDYQAVDETYLSFQRGDKLTIYSKYDGKDSSIWQGSLGGTPAKFLPKDFVKETTTFYKEDKLLDLGSDAEGHLKAPENEGQPSERSQRHNEEQDKPNQGDSATDSLENSGVSDDSPVETSRGNDDTQTVPKDLAKEDANEAADKVVEETTNEDKVNEDLNQDALINERTGQDSQQQINNPKTGDENQVLDNGDEDFQETTNIEEVNDEGVDDKTERTSVFTDSNGIQYDVKMEYLDQQDEGSNDVKVVGVTEEELPLNHEDDSPKKVDENKKTDEDQTKKTSGGDEERRLKEGGFFSSVRSIVSDFTENVMKDLQGNSEGNDKKIESSQDKEDPEDSEKVIETADDEVKTRQDDLKTNSSGFKGLQERFQQIKAAHREKVKEEMAQQDKEEILKAEAKRTVEEIPGLIKEEKNEGGEKKDEKVKDEETGNKDERPKLPVKKYSDKVLCRSVPLENREICLPTESKEECLQDNCCFDDTADAGRQCFFKPSAPEGGFTEEELQVLLSEDIEMSGEDKMSVVKTDDSTEGSNTMMSDVAEQSDKTTDASSEAQVLADVGSENAGESETVDKSGDEDKNSAKSDVAQTSEADTHESEDTDSVEKTNAIVTNTVAVGASDSSDEVSPSSQKDSLSEENDAAETVDSTATGKHPEEKLLEAKDDEQENVDENDAKDGITEDKDGAFYEDKATVDTQSTDNSVGPSIETSSVNATESGDETVLEKSASGSDESVEKEVSSVENISEDAVADDQNKMVKSVHDSENGARSAEGDLKEDLASSDAGPKDQEQVEQKAIDEDRNPVGRSDEVGEEEESEDKILDEVGDETRSSDENVDDSKSALSLQDEPAGEKDGKESQQATECQQATESTGVEDKTEEIAQDSQDVVTASEATLIQDDSQAGSLTEGNVDEKKKEQPDAEGIFATIKKLLPGGGNTEENRKSEEKTSDKALNVNKVKVPEQAEKVSSADSEDRKEVHYDAQKRSKEDETSEDVKLRNDSETNTNVSDSAEEGLEKEFDGSETSDEQMAEDLLADLLEAESNTKDATVSETGTHETEVNPESVKSGSTHFVNNTKATFPVEKTVDKELEVDNSTSHAAEESETDMKKTESESGVKETKTGLGFDVVPTKTSFSESSETITAGHRPFEKKFSKIASKWRKNRLMKGKGIAKEKTSEGKTWVEETSGETPEEEAPKVETTEEKTSEDTKKNLDLEDPHSGTCSKDGTCKGGIPYSSVVHRSILEIDDSRDDDDIVEPSPPEEEPDVKSVKTQFLEMLAGAVRKFREYHNLAAKYGLKMLKPLRNVVKSLGEQMGLGETIDYVEHELNQGPQGAIAVLLIIVTFVAYFLLSIMCGKGVPPAYGPNLKDIFKTYEGRIRILEEECSDYEEKLNNLKKEVNERGENSCELEKQLEVEKHERNKSDEQIAIHKKIVENYVGKVKLLEEESSILKQSLDEKTKRIDSFEEQLSDKSSEIDKSEASIKKLEEYLQEKDEEKSSLNEMIEEYKKQLSKAEDDADRHKTMLQDWNDRYHELQQKYDDISVSNQTLEEQIHFKDNEIEVLRESLVQINNDVKINSDEELSQEEMQEERSKKINELMDVSQIRTDFKLCKEEKETLENDMKQEVDRREKLEGEVEQLEIDLAKSKASEEEIRFKYREADIKLNALQDYFKNMESDLHRKLTAEEAARMASESELERKLREASTAVQDVELYRKQVEELRKEIDETQQSFRSQISSTEERAHENWLKFRSAERELEEMKRERDALRRRLYDLETSTKAQLEDAVASTTADNLESPVPRSESPASSIRSSKRKTSNFRKSPSPLDERKERVRRKNRDRNSPPSWDQDMGPPRRREKDRETPPPPPPLWDPNMAPRRKGQRESPSMDTERRRRERYTPSPPPPPLDMNPSSRRKRRDRPTPSSSPPPPPRILAQRDGIGPGERSSSPPPPPPTHLFSPRGGGFPSERSAVPPIRGGPPRMNAPFTRPPQNVMAPRPVGNGVVRGPWQMVMPLEMQRSPRNMTYQETSPPRGPPPPGVSPLRGIRPPWESPSEQSSMYTDSSSLSNTGEDSDKPPPPPPFARNGPYTRPPPRRDVQTLPS